MRNVLSGVSCRNALAPGMYAVLLMAGTSVEAACPDYVTLPSGTAFNLAALIADTGSPDNALRKARSLVAHVNANGGCPQSAELAVCEEILAVTRKAIVALEACSSSGVPSVKMPENEWTASK
jgi:hypothetical protein